MNRIISEIRSVRALAAKFDALPKDARREAVKRIERDASVGNILEVLASEAEAVKGKTK